jgi:hypothetical protein
MEEPNYDAIGGAAAGGEMFGFVTPQDLKMMGMAILYLAVVLIMVISSWKVFSKAGKPGIASIIPIWNIVVMVEMAGKPVSWVLLILLVPCANIYFAIMLVIELAKRFGKSPGFGVGLILLPFIFWPMLAFGSAQYQAPAPNEPSGNEPSE